MAKRTYSNIISPTNPGAEQFSKCDTIDPVPEVTINDASFEERPCEEDTD